MATKAEIIIELKKYPEYKDIKETILMRELKDSLQDRLQKVTGISNISDIVKKTIKPKNAKIDFNDDSDTINDDSIIDDFELDDLQNVEDDFPY